MSNSCHPLFVTAGDLDKITKHIPVLRSEESRMQAAIALIIRDTDHGSEFLLMQRAHHQNDPWSGQMSFPGGKIEASDLGSKQAAIRESFEEVGIQLGGSNYVGRLNDLFGFKVDGVYMVHLACFVFKVSPDVVITPNYEVADTVWVPFSSLETPANYYAHESALSSVTQMPAVMIDSDKEQILWGLSLRILVMLFDVLAWPMTTLDDKTKHIMRTLDRQNIDSSGNPALKRVANRNG